MLCGRIRVFGKISPIAGRYPTLVPDLLQTRSTGLRLGTVAQDDPAWNLKAPFYT